MRWGNLRWTVGAFLLMAQCSETAEDPRHVALRAANQTCKAKLSQADYLEASSGALKALVDTGMLATDPKLADELRFCQAYARTLYALDASSTFIRKFAVAMSDLFEARQAPSPYQPQAGTLQTTILDNVITAILTPLMADLETVSRTYAAVAGRGNFTWTIDRLPVKIAGTELFDAAGAYDEGEVEILRGLVGMVQGGLYSLQSLDYRVNTSAIVEYAKLADSPLKHFEDHPVAGFFNAAAVLLGTAPSFLALKEKDGAQWMAKAGAGYAAAVKSMLDASAFIKAREGDQKRHLVEYKHDDQDYLILHLKFNKKLSSAFKIDLEKFTDTSIPLRNDVLQSMTHVYESLKAGGGVRASVQDDVFPILALMGVVALKSGALDAAVKDSLDQIDPILARQLQLTLDYGELSQEHFLSLLLIAVPMKMEVDVGRTYAQPVNLREMVPAWFQPDGNAGGGFAMQAFTAATLVVEYECPQNPILTGAAKKIFCEGPVDQSHFQALGTTFPWKNQADSDNFGSLWQNATAADGIASRAPYVGFKDPTFGGTLFMDYTLLNVTPPSAETFAPANQAGVNAVLSTLTEAVLTVYQ